MANQTYIELNPEQVIVEILDTGILQVDFQGGPPGPAGPSGSLENVDDELTGSDLSLDGLKAALTAGEALIFGEVCYISAAGKCLKADATSATTSRAVALSSGLIDIDTDGDFLLLGFARNDSWSLTVGGEIYLSEISGTFTQTAPITLDSVTQVLGIAIATNRIYFNPSSDLVIHN